MKAIATRFVGATDHRGSRIIATDGDNRLVLPYPHELDGDAAHDAAAVAFCRKLKWTGRLARGGTKTGNVYVFTDGPAFTGFVEVR